jgi:hypothetical protein
MPNFSGQSLRTKYDASTGGRQGLAMSSIVPEATLSGVSKVAASEVGDTMQKLEAVDTFAARPVA